MIKTSNPVVFFGSGPVAGKSLEALARDFVIEAVVTKTGDSKNPNLVEAVASSHGFKLLSAANKAELDNLFDNNEFSSELGLVIDYGIIISSRVITAFKLGIINSHFSLLPQWRGADPITFAILSGQPTTGVSLMLINEKLDEGQLLTQRPHEIPPHSTTPELTASLMSLSHDMLKAVVPEYIAGSITPYPQDLAKDPTYSRKLTKADGKIDWNKSAPQLEREIRAYIDWPKSYTEFGGREVVLTRANVVELSGQPGQIDLADKKHLIVYCAVQALDILRLKPAGKPDMSAEAFLAGYRALLS
jgi:methionyl-tRNA formyltransferase